MGRSIIEAEDRRMQDPLRPLHDELSSNVDAMLAVARATHRLGNAVEELMASLPEATRAELARQLAEELQKPNP
jgi:hypothetical protein